MIPVIREIQTDSYRCLNSIVQSLNPIEILIGANASGKSTFLDVVAFLGDFIRNGLEAAVAARTTNFHDLVWGREGSSFLISVEACIPEGRGRRGALSGADTIRYDLGISLDTVTETLGVTYEQAVVSGGSQPDLKIIERNGTHLQFLSEVPRGQSYDRDQQHRSYSGLTSVPADSNFPVAAWFRELLREGVQKVVLDTRDLQRPSPPGRGDGQTVTGVGLARSIAHLADGYRNRFSDWIRHVRTALPDVRTIRTVVREEDKHRYLMIEYENGMQIPSWMVSEGTLRLLALTILAYMPSTGGVYLVEEPENGVHPTALETIFQSLSSVSDAQVLVASHSPILLNMATPEQILVFSKITDGVKIVRGKDHPALRDWQRDVSLGTLAASGILE